MKLNALLLYFLLAVSICACKDDEPEEAPSLPEYSITINSPNGAEITAGESLHIHVDFDEPNGLTVHHVNVQLTTDIGEVLYDGPSVAHVHTDGGHYELHDDVDINVEPGTELTLTAKVWGHTAGTAEQTTTASFVAVQ